MKNSEMLLQLDIRRWDAKIYAELAFVLYFSISFWWAGFGKALSFVGLSEYGSVCATILAYIPLIIACVKDPRKYIKWDAVLLYAAIAVFFLANYLIHPENKYWFLREEYGAWDHVFFPRNGLYAYLFVRLIDKPEDFFRLIKIAAAFMFVYFFYQIMVTLERGYWEGVAGLNGKAHMAYSVSFAYSVLLYTLPFLYDAIKKKGIVDILFSFTGCKMILDYGGRGGTFCVIGFLVINFIVYVYEEKKVRDILLTYLAGIILFLVYNAVCDWGMLSLQSVFSDASKIDETSRFLTMVKDGEMFASNGRIKIWSVAINMIKENPWGYGAMGSRPVISQIIIAGYPHNLFLDLWIDFGIIVGSIIGFFFVCVSINILFRKKNHWADCFICTFCGACGLLISLTFWASRPFWLTLGIVVNYYTKEMWPISRVKRKDQPSE